MPTPLVVNNNTFEYPIPGDEPGWGEGATGWAVEVTDVLSNLQGTDDIPETTFSVANNVASPANVVGLLFNSSTVRAGVIDYSVYRSNEEDFDPTDVNITTNIITIVGHVLTNDSQVTFATTGGLPGGLSGGTYYYVVNAATNTFQVAATVGGSAIDLTTQGTGVHTVRIELAEKGKFEFVFKNGAPVGTKWSMGRVFFGDDAGMVFSMTDAGQMQYTSTNLNGTDYSGTMKFEATVTQQ